MIVQLFIYFYRYVIWMPLLFLGVVLINGFLNKKGIFFFIFLLQLGSVHFSVLLRIGDVYHAMSIYSFFHYC